MKRAAAVILVAVVLTSCNNRAQSADTRAAGGALMYGFRVPAGAIQTGPMIPCELAPGIADFSCERGSTAYFDVRRHPDSALNALLAQGYRAGYHGGVRCQTFRGLLDCRGELHEGTSVEAVPPKYPPVGPDGKRDKTKYETPIPAARPRGRSVIVQLRYGVDGSQQSIAQLTVQFTDRRPANGCENWPPCARSVRAPDVPAPHVAAPANVGDLLEPQLQSKVKVLPGSKVVMHVSGTDSTNGRFLTLLRVHGDLDAAFTAYRDAIARGPYAGHANNEGARDVAGGWHLRSWSFSGYDGGPEVRLSVARNGDQSYLALFVTPYA